MGRTIGLTESRGVNKFGAREGTMENGRSILSLILKVLGIIVFAAGLVFIVLLAVVFGACSGAFR